MTMVVPATQQKSANGMKVELQKSSATLSALDGTKVVDMDEWLSPFRGALQERFVSMNALSLIKNIEYIREYQDIEVVPSKHGHITIDVALFS
jgi:hypothetical protein